MLNCFMQKTDAMEIRIPVGLLFPLFSCCCFVVVTVVVVAVVAVIVVVAVVVVAVVVSLLMSPQVLFLIPFWTSNLQWHPTSCELAMG